MKKLTMLLTGSAVVVGGAFAGAAIAEHGGRGWDRGEGRHGGMFRGNREVTKEQAMERARGRFGRLDADGDGSLSREEIANRVGRRMERRMERMGRRAERRLRRRDANNDGAVSREEFREAGLRRFRRFDIDGNGVITDADLPPMARGRDLLTDGEFRGRGRRGRMLRALRRADANDDGQITEQEATAAINRRFDRFDRNSDGKLDEADRTALQSEMRDYGVARFLNRFEAREAGSVSRDAFLKQAEERFARRDADNDGVLRGRELRRGRWGRGGHRGHRGRGYHRGGDEGRGRRDREGGNQTRI